MAVPVTYDKNTFANYIKNEVLLYVADSMEWFSEIGADTVPSAPQAVQLDGASVLNSPTVPVDALPAKIYAGNPIQFSGFPEIYRAAADAEAGATVLYLFPYVKQVMPDNTPGSYTPFNERDTHPAYFAILDEALLQLGYTDVSQVTGVENIQRLRMMGRIEAWRAVMANTCGDTSTEMEGVFYNRGTTFFDARDQLVLAEQEYGRMFGLNVSQPPTYTTSSITNVRGAW